MTGHNLPLELTAAQRNAVVGAPLRRLDSRRSSAARYAESRARTMKRAILLLALAVSVPQAFCEPIVQDPTCSTMEESLARMRDRAKLDSKELRHARSCLKLIRGERFIPDLLKLADQPEESVASAAAIAIVSSLGKKPKNAKPTLQALLRNHQASVRNECLRYLLESPADSSLAGALAKIVHADSDEANRIAAIHTLGEWKIGRREIERALKDESESVRGAAAFEIKRLDGKL